MTEKFSELCMLPSNVELAESKEYVATHSAPGVLKSVDELNAYLSSLAVENQPAQEKAK